MGVQNRKYGDGWWWAGLRWWQWWRPSPFSPTGAAAPPPSLLFGRLAAASPVLPLISWAAGSVPPVFLFPILSLLPAVLLPLRRAGTGLVSIISVRKIVVDSNDDYIQVNSDTFPSVLSPAPSWFLSPPALPLSGSSGSTATGNKVDSKVKQCNIMVYYSAILWWFQ